MVVQSQSLNAARGGDEAAFRALVTPHRKGLLAHCYRMSGSLHDAEDLVQEALLRAWKGLSGFQERSSFQTWIYRIATHATLDALRSAKARGLPVALEGASNPNEPPAGPNAEPVWLEPFPDALLPDTPPADAHLSMRQSVAFAFLQVLQRLPPSQRAAVLLKDVVGMSAAEIAELLETTPAATNSLIQRARETLGRAPEPEPLGDEEERALVGRYISAWERADVDGLVTLLADDARLSMPPVPSWFDGAGAIGAWLGKFVLPTEAAGRFVGRRTRANGLPAVALYQRADEGGFELQGVHTIDMRGEHIVEVVAFMDPRTFRFFEVPPHVT
jgi:RNA polymerase sigma-70 factor (ECF subfamily)